MTNRQHYNFYPCGDQAVTLELGTSIDLYLNQQIHALHQYIRSFQLPFIKDIIPSYHTLTLVYDAAMVRKLTTTTAYDYVVRLMDGAWQTRHAGVSGKRQIRIPVCYGHEYGPDLDSLAATKGISTDELIALHCNRPYQVYLIGFLPGFAYMGTVDERIASPRKAVPALQVPAGTVGIAGKQTGIYPLNSPGGWQLIGRTPFVMFDPHRASPSLLQPGDEVVFYSVTKAQFKKHRHEPARN